MADLERANLTSQAETASKEFWQDPIRVAKRYSRDPNDSQFRMKLNEFNQDVVEPARFTEMLGTFFERKLSSV